VSGPRRRLPRRLRAGAALALAVGALVILAAQGSAPAQDGGSSIGPAGPGRPSADERPVVGPLERPAPGVEPGDPALVAAGRRLFVEGCSSCHGEDARGVRGRGPSLRGVGAAAADFYLDTGRMPLDDPHDEPIRAKSPYDPEQRRALIAYVAQFGGPPIPRVDPAKGELSEGLELFTDHCASCHQVVGRGGMLTGAVVPDLEQSEPVTVAEAIEVGPYLMPNFRGQFEQREIDSIARYVEYTKEPEDRGGWGIGNVGPVSEGMVAWLLAGGALLLTIRLIGERTPE
jgi:ubiquinol-cytochrome c reductase cytochrome c subunit